MGTAAHGRQTAPSALFCGLLSTSTPLPALRFRFRAATSTLILFHSEKSITPSPSSYPTHSSPAASPHTPLAARRAPHLCAQPRSATGARRATRCGGAREWRRAGPPLSTRLRPCGHSRCRLAAARWRCALKLPAARSEPFSTAEDASSR